MNINTVLLFGNLTRDPELRALPSGMNVCSFSIATNRTFTDKDGKKQEQVEFHNIIVFGRQADSVAQYLKKGSSAFVEGRLQTRSWEDKKSGEKKYRTEIVAERVQFGPKRQEGGSRETQDEDRDVDGGEPARTTNKTGSKKAAHERAEDDIDPDEIPF